MKLKKYQKHVKSVTFIVDLILVGLSTTIEFNEIVAMEIQR